MKRKLVKGSTFAEKLQKIKFDPQNNNICLFNEVKQKNYQENQTFIGAKNEQKHIF